MTVEELEALIEAADKLIDFAMDGDVTFAQRAAWLETLNAIRTHVRILEETAEAAQ